MLQNIKINFCLIMAPHFKNLTILQFYNPLFPLILQHINKKDA